MGWVPSRPPQAHTHDPNSERRFRAVLFACDGHVIHQTDADRILDQNGASIELHYEASKLQAQDTLAVLLARHITLARRHLEQAEKVFASLTKQGPLVIPRRIETLNDGRVSTPVWVG